MKNLFFSGKNLKRLHKWIVLVKFLDLVGFEDKCFIYCLKIVGEFMIFEWE